MLNSAKNILVANRFPFQKSIGFEIKKKISTDLDFIWYATTDLRDIIIFYPLGMIEIVMWSRSEHEQDVFRSKDRDYSY